MPTKEGYEKVMDRLQAHHGHRIKSRRDLSLFREDFFRMFSGREDSDIMAGAVALIDSGKKLYGNDPLIPILLDFVRRAMKEETAEDFELSSCGHCDMGWLSLDVKRWGRESPNVVCYPCPYCRNGDFIAAQQRKHRVFLDRREQDQTESFREDDRDAIDEALQKYDEIKNLSRAQITGIMQAWAAGEQEPEYGQPFSAYQARLPEIGRLPA